jgi:hypothetical protein
VLSFLLKMTSTFFYFPLALVISLTPLGWVAVGVLGFIVLLLLLWWLFELQYRGRAGNRLELSQGDWQLEVRTPERYRLNGEFTAVNQTRKLDIFLTEVTAELTLLADGSLADVTHRIAIASQHPDASGRVDNYWEAYIVKGGRTTALEVQIEIEGAHLDTLQAAWVRVNYVTYGPGGRVPKVRHCVIPLQFPEPESVERWRPTANADVLPIRTHLLSTLDTPVDVMRRYVTPHAQPGDIVTIGESPLAIMQGRMRHPTDIKPGWLAKRLCYYFLPTSSLATACGLQSLVDEVGAWRVAFAFIFGSIAKAIFRIPGMFYVLAGGQARLVDDVTGTLPPYDQFVVLGPVRAQAVVDEILAETGLEAAIVDVNDLKAVSILAATPGVSDELLNQALLLNPAGNAAEQTPIVLIRPN